MKKEGLVVGVVVMVGVGVGVFFFVVVVRVVEVVVLVVIGTRGRGTNDVLLRCGTGWCEFKYISAREMYPSDQNHDQSQGCNTVANERM